LPLELDKLVADKHSYAANWAASSLSSLSASSGSTSYSADGGGVVEMVEVETVVEAAGHRRCGSALRRWYAGDEAWLAVKKGMMTAAPGKKMPFGTCD
jgi:hypothetical protein